MISIDPSVENVGYALWFDLELQLQGTMYGQGNDWVEKLNHAAHNLSCMAEQIKRSITIAYELPQALSNVCAASGNLVKLSIAAGQLVGSIYRGGDLVVPVPIPKWKGNMSDEQTKQRVERCLRINKIKHEEIKSFHEADAIGIGLYQLGLF